MCELVIVVRDKIDHNPMLLGEHEVICVCEDGHPFSVIERAHPDWRIVKLPGVPRDDGNRWIANEQVDETQNVRRRRHFKLVPTRLSAPDRAWYDDDSRTEPARVFDSAAWDGLFRTRVPMQRQDVIGDPATEIG